MTDDSESALVKAIRARADAKEGSAQETESLARLEKLINDQDAMKDESKDLLGAAIFLVAWAHDAGIGERKVDLSLATELYRRGAKIGDVRCMSGLGSILLSDKVCCVGCIVYLVDGGEGGSTLGFEKGVPLSTRMLHSIKSRRHTQICKRRREQETPKPCSISA